MKLSILSFIVGCLIAALTGNMVAAEEGALLIYSFDEGQGATVKDLSTSGNDGTLQGDATWTKDGKFGGGVSFDGDEDYVDCGESDELQFVETDFTLAAWVYPTAISQQSFGGGVGGTIFQTVRTPADSEGFLIGIKNTGVLWWWNTHNIDKYSVSTVPLDEWTHVAVVFTYKGGGNNTLEFYLNGKLDATATGVPDMKSSPTSMCIGHRSWCTGWFKGVMDEARVYARTLSQDEISRVAETRGAGVDAERKLITLWGALKLQISGRMK